MAETFVPSNVKPSDNITTSERQRRRARVGTRDPYRAERAQVERIECVDLDHESDDERRARRRLRQGGSVSPRPRTPLSVAEDELAAMLGPT